MTTITIDRATVEQALEALEEYAPQHGHPDDLMAVLFALRAALAQQVEPVQVAERERIAAQWDGCVIHQLDTFGPVDVGASIRAGELVEAQQAEPVKPVATLTAQRGALLEALRKIGQYTGEGPTYSTPWQDIVVHLGQTARAAIKAVEETK